jgi:hypothetical protein
LQPQIRVLLHERGDVRHHDVAGNTGGYAQPQVAGNAFLASPYGQPQFADPAEKIAPAL